MRKLPLLLLGLAAVACVAGAATAKTWSVTITKNGYVPNSLTITQGDTVSFTNSDTVAHQIAFKSNSGFSCTPNPLVLQPAASGSCTFQSAGSFNYDDPNAKGRTFRGSITVNGVPESLSLAAAPKLVVYGGKATLSGTLSTQKAGESIDVMAQQCGTNGATKAATVQTTTGGAYTSPAQPLMNTAYTTKLRNTASPAASVQVRPRLALAKVAPHRYTLRVFAGSSFAGKYASFQRYNATLRRWVAVKSVALKANSTGVAPTVITAAAFRSTVKAGLRVRATLAQTQVGGCYAPGSSNTIRS